MKSYSTALAGVLLFEPQRYEDARGYFSETFNLERFRAAGLPADIAFVQDNQSFSCDVGTVRGLHFQAPPYAQSKLVRVLRGAVRDVAVDARKGSPTYGLHVAAELSAENGLQIFIPAGFLHGFITLTPDTEVLYKVDAYYSREHDGSVLWNDQDLGIDWGPAAARPVLSDKDRTAQPFGTFVSPFRYER